MTKESRLPDWESLIAGQGCPMCLPQAEADAFGITVAELDVSTLRVIRDQTYYGYCVMRFNKRHVTGIEHLSSSEYASFMQDLKRSAAAISKAVNPDLMNYATLGNVIPHLHYHIIPRYKNDPRWRGPIWTTHMEEMTKTRLTDEGYQELVNKIRAALAG